MDGNLYRRGHIITAFTNTILDEEERNSTQIEDIDLSPFQLRDEPWSVPLLAVASSNIIIIIMFEIYVIIRAFQGTPSRRHLFLGQCLLAGLLLMSLSGIPFTLKQNTVTCAASRFLVGVAPASVFAVLLVKYVFLISLNSGVYLPYYYQGLLLFFVILVQAVISIQWLLTQPAEMRLFEDRVTNDIFESCAASYKQYLIFLIYVMCLIVLVAAVSLKCRGIRENYRESSYISVSVGLTIPAWIIWCFTGFILPHRLQPACLAFSMVLTATFIFIIMFIPKGRQLSAAGQDGLYREDREDTLSTLSSARYSPSFFLFKPVKGSKEILKTNSIYKPDIPEKLGFGVQSYASPFHKPVPSITPPYQYALPKYARTAPQYWPLYNYYRHYYSGHESDRF